METAFKESMGLYAATFGQEPELAQDLRGLRQLPPRPEPLVPLREAGFDDFMQSQSSEFENRRCPRLRQRQAFHHPLRKHQGFCRRRLLWLRCVRAA